MNQMDAFTTDPPELHLRLIPPTLLNASRLDFYRKRWSGIDLRGIGTPEELEKLPLLTKDDLGEYLGEFRHEGEPALVSHSSGTTGLVTVRCRSRQEVDFLWDFYSRMLTDLDTGVLPLGLVVNSANHGQETPIPAHGFGLVANGIGPTVVDQVARMLLRRYSFPGVSERVRILVCVLGFLKLLTVELRRRNVEIADLGVEQIYVTGDHLSTRWRQALMQAWQSEIINTYSVSEIFGGAKQCAECECFSFEPPVIAQIVDPWTHQPTRSGVGLLVLTELFPFVQYQPLVRYVPGDLVELRPSACDEHRGPAFRFLGRWGDVVTDPERGICLLYPSEVASLLDGFPELERSEHFEEIPLTEWNRDLAPVLGRISRTHDGRRQRVTLHLAPRFSPAVFPDAAKALKERISTALLDGCSGLHHQVEAGAVAVDIVLGVASQLDTAICPN